MAKPPKKLKLKLNIRPKQKDPAPKKKKIRTVSMTDAEDTPPWDTDVISEAEAVISKSKKGKKTVRRLGEDEDFDEQDRIDEEASVNFQKSMARVAKRVSNKTQAYNSPAVQEIVTRAALASVLRQLSKAERNYKASGAERAAYAYTNLINQVRDLMADLRAMSSTDALADEIIRSAVTPAFLQLVNYVVNEVGVMRSKITGASSIDALQRQLNEQLNKMLTEIGQYGDETLEKASENAKKALKV